MTSRLTPNDAGRVALPCGATASAVIDLAAEPAPAAFKVADGLYAVRDLPLLPLLRLHTDDLADDSRPLLTDGHTVSPPPGGAMLFPPACDRCEVKLTIMTGDDAVWHIAEHQRGCRAFGRMLRRAGLS